MSRTIIRRSTAIAATGFVALALSSGIAQAQDISNAPTTIIAAADQSAGTLTQVSEAEFVLRPSAGVSVAVTATGASLTDGSTSEALPTSATDKTGAPVELRYVQGADGLHIQVIDRNQSSAEPAPGTETQEGFWQCALGTAGGAGGGGLAGAGVGSALPGLGTAAGGIIGGLSGAATGAAASCF
ncbi:hypothetical protein [Rhodococcoides yunnanense]|uniref:Uncharacterized protein n=1 Tax=Rhodococcoides yunnanense TaxID=278209 RepID=A0ABU4B764_9NOCA|nr:hypothetical protein [Rhodococcus yunnanensis]MDV6260029.1 hypothetical protein [Rhodococcus yunnanensis]